MKIAIDKGPLTGGDRVRGVGVYTKELAEHLGKIKDVQISLVDVGKEDLSKFDLVHYQKFHPYFFSIPFNKIKPSVLTIHDLIYLIYPEAYPSGLKGKAKFMIQKPLVRNMDAIITVSETTKKDVVRFLGIPPEKIYPIYEAPREIFKKLFRGKWQDEVRKKFSLPERFVLYVGDVNFNKNILTMVEACKKVKIPVVIVGKQAASLDFDRNHPENKSFVELVDKYGDDKDVIRLGFVEEGDLVSIYNLATLYCQPSYYEGFGLPILEAIACECPVVASRTQALVEIGEPACLFADAKDSDDFADNFTKLLENNELKSQLTERGKVLLKNYSWEKTARLTLEVYKKVLGK